MARKPGTDNRIFALTVRLTAAEYKLITIAAKKEDLNASQLLRRIMKERLDKPTT